MVVTTSISQAKRDLQLTFPALYLSADEASNREQRFFLWLVRGEYALLMIAAIFSMSTWTTRPFYVAYAMVFVLTLFCLLYRSSKKPEQDWYKCRALAESVKTSTWRYVMRAEPFNVENGAEVRKAFRAYLGEILNSNQHIGEKIAGLDSTGAQSTREMDEIRTLPWKSRADLYEKDRIQDQRRWYDKKSRLNSKIGRRWALASGSVYVVALLLVLCHIASPEQKFLPIEPLIVLGSIMLGWGQIKKFN